MVLIEPKVFVDQRGFFREAYKRSDFTKNGIPENFVQDNVSLSHQNVLRGLHYQRNPKPMGKLISVLLGEVWDVAVDLREGSPTFGGWVSAILSDKNHNMLYVPEGFAHGFYCVSEQAIVEYKVTNEFDSELDSGFLWNDPKVAVEWPTTRPILSEKDSNLPLFQKADHNFTYSPGV